MKTEDIQVGSTITNGSEALRITEKVIKDVRWGTPGWRGINIPTEQYGGNPGTTSFVPDYLVGSWCDVPFEWTPCTGGGVEERYVWTPDWRRLQREVRRVPGNCPTFPGKACDRAEGHDPHLWIERDIPSGNPLVPYTQWWQCGEKIRPLAVGDRVRFKDDQTREGVGLVCKVLSDLVSVETAFNMWRGYPADLFVRTDDPLPAGLGVVDGIRPHRPMSAEDEAAARAHALALPRISAEEFQRVIDEMP